MTSRITFYTHYDDKYALVEDMFCGYIGEAVRDYHRPGRRKTIPPARRYRGYYNMLDCILNLYYNNLAFFRGPPGKKPRTLLLLPPYFLQCRRIYPKAQPSDGIKLSFAANRRAALCNGLWGVINECYASGTPREDMRKDIRSMFHDILVFALFSKKKRPVSALAGKQAKGRPMAARFFAVWLPVLCPGRIRIYSCRCSPFRLF